MKKHFLLKLISCAGTTSLARSLALSLSPSALLNQTLIVKKAPEAEGASEAGRKEEDAISAGSLQIPMELKFRFRCIIHF